MPDEGEVTTVRLDREVRFRTLLGELLPVRVGALQLGSAEGAAACTLEGEVEWETYTRILAAEAFNLLPDVRNDAGVTLEEGVPVEVKLALRPALAGVLAADQDADALVTALLGADSKSAASALRLSESWLALEVKQRVPLPPDLAASGSLKVGYRTQWQLSEVVPPSEVSDEPEAPETLAEVVEAFLTQRGWEYERLREGLFRLAIRSGPKTWTALATTDEEKQLFLFYSVYPEHVPEERRAAVAQYLVDVNYALLLGGFEMDMEDGELRLRTSIDVENDRLSPALVAQLVDTNVTVMDGEFEHLERLIAGDAASDG